MYFWCKLRFNPDGTCTRYSIEQFQSVQEFVHYFARLMYRYVWYNFDTPAHQAEEALKRLEKTQNLTGRDTERVVLRTVFDPETGRYEVTADYELKNMQFVSVENGHVRTLDIRFWHNEILEEFNRGVGRLPHFRPCKCRVRQGRTHKQWGGYHWQAGIVGTLRHISEGKVRTKRASKFRGAVDYDPKLHDTENNWKQTKCRHQWEWHKKKHQDRVYLPEEDRSNDMKDNRDTADLEAMRVPELWAELDRLEAELDYQVSHKRIAELQERIEEVENELAKRG